MTYAYMILMEVNLIKALKSNWCYKTLYFLALAYLIANTVYNIYLLFRYPSFDVWLIPKKMYLLYAPFNIPYLIYLFFVAAIKWIINFVHSVTIVQKLNFLATINIYTFLALVLYTVVIDFIALLIRCI